MENLLSRKQICEELGISMRTLCRKLKELNIECVNEILKNGVVSMKIRYDDYLKIAGTCTSQNTSRDNSNTEAKDLVIINALKAELIKVKVDYESTLKLLNEKDKVIVMLQEDKRKFEEDKIKAEEKNERLFNEYMRINEELQKEKSKSLWKRIFNIPSR